MKLVVLNVRESTLPDAPGEKSVDNQKVKAVLCVLVLECASFCTVSCE